MKGGSMEWSDVTPSRAPDGRGAASPGSERRPRLAAWPVAAGICCAILVLGAVYYIRAYIRAGKYWVADSDYQVFYGAAVAVRHHANPFLATMAWIHQYSPHQHLGMGFATKSYVYPPFFAFLQVPFSLLSLRHALVAWDLLNVIFLVGAIYALLRVVDIRPSALEIFVFATAALLLDPIRKELFIGQADIFLLFLVCTALWARFEERPYMAGILLAVACAIKPPLLVWVVFLLWKRELKVASTAVLGALVLFFAPFLWLGAHVWHDQLTIFQFWSNQFLAFDHNDSPKGVLVRLFTANPVVRPLVVAPALVTALWLVVAAVVLLLTAARIRPQPLNRDRRTLLEIALVVPAALLLTPLTEWPYLLMLIIPLLMVYGWVRQSGPGAPVVRFVAWGAVATALLLTGPLTWTENHIAAHMVATRAVTADLLVLLAPGYLYLLIGVFALQLYALGRASNESTLTAIRNLVTNAPAILTAVKDAARVSRTDSHTASVLSEQSEYSAGTTQRSEPVRPVR